MGQTGPMAGNSVPRQQTLDHVEILRRVGLKILGGDTEQGQRVAVAEVDNGAVAGERGDIGGRTDRQAVDSGLDPDDVVIDLEVQHDVAAAAALEVEDVVARATGEIIVAIAAFELIVTRAAVEAIVVLPAVEQIVAAAAVERVLAGLAVEPVVAAVAADSIIAGTRRDEIVERCADDEILMCAARNRCHCTPPVSEKSRRRVGRRRGAGARDRT